MKALTLLIISNVINCFGLIAIRILGGTTQGSMQILFSGFFLVAVISFAFSKPWRLTAKDGLYYSAWALTQFLAYILFYSFPTKVSLSQLIIVKSMAPFVSIIILLRGKVNFTRAIPLVFLVIIAYINNIGAGNWVLFGILFISSLGSQLLSRVTPLNQNSMLLTILTLNSFTFLFLAQWLAVDKVSIISPLSGYSVALSIIIYLLFSVLLVAVHVLNIYGLRTENKVAEALGVSSSVPISILIEYLFVKTHFNPGIFVLSILYLISIFFTIRSDTDRPWRVRRYELPENSSA